MFHGVCECILSVDFVTRTVRLRTLITQTRNQRAYGTAQLALARDTLCVVCFGVCSASVVLVVTRTRHLLSSLLVTRTRHLLSSVGDLNMSLVVICFYRFSFPVTTTLQWLAWTHVALSATLTAVWVTRSTWTGRKHQGPCQRLDFQLFLRKSLTSTKSPG